MFTSTPLMTKMLHPESFASDHLWSRNNSVSNFREVDESNQRSSPITMIYHFRVLTFLWWGKMPLWVSAILYFTS